MSEFETESVLDYQVAIACKANCISLIGEWIRSDRPPKSFMCANPHSLYEASKDNVFKSALKSADLLTPDGSGIILASKLLGGRIESRITGSDVFLGLSEHLNNNKRGKYFFLGSTESTLAQIKKRMAVDYPNIEIVGTYSPPFKTEFDESDNRTMLEAINIASPDVLWVGMTAPKQEKWILANKDKINARFIGAIGAVFDFYVGNVKRSHPFFQSIGLEWLPRLVQEPRRLWRRNFISSPMFLIQVFRQKWSK